MFIWMRATRCTADVVDSRLPRRSISCSQALPKEVARLFPIASGLEVHRVRCRITTYPKFSEYHLRSLIATYRSWSIAAQDTREKPVGIDPNTTECPRLDFRFNLSSESKASGQALRPIESSIQVNSKLAMTDTKSLAP